MTYLLYFTAICLSAVAAYYSIAGLASIFSAAVIPIVVMGSVLEFAKLVVASWIYRSWHQIPILMRAYFTTALIILMLLTSMGIFGYLSKAHLDQAVPTGDVSSKLAIYDEKIKTEKDNIEAARAQLKQMDSAVDQTMSRSDDSKGAERSLQIRKSQQKERANLLNEIGTAQGKIAKLNDERAPIASELRKVEAEVGPIKYIAALLYGDNPDQNILEKAVRIVIIMIVIVFDPLAVLLLMAASIQLKPEGETNGNSTKETTSEESPSTSEATSEATSEESADEEESQITRIKERFFSKFTAPRATSLGERTPDNSSDGGSEQVSSSSPGVAIAVQDYTTAVDQTEVLKTDWQISSPPEHVELELDSAGRIMTPVHADYIVDWSNKDSTPKAVPKS
jgi:hypothetical protein